MQALFTHKNFTIHKLDTNLIAKHSQQICTSLNQIPLVEPHTKKYLLQLEKPGRKLHHKFDHSLIALSGNNYAGVIIGYERESEGNEQYPRNSIYLSDFAVSQDFQKQGLGSYLIQCWLEHNTAIGFLEFTGDLAFSVQTNSAAWNTHVQNMYESFGFRKTAVKEYENRVDSVFFKL